ncbi:motility associated factor glycosyltransferase family protein [Paramaledivibacter caminithermalis]|jgi:hypothetical protein|uniref:Uncharacterized conserved protein n=1 Tax=Paramaledivibacter caminithermalis (strain DSM 15212 / CIP 107654 / DViRD3) TaxID=1121301 RepID=A0A1M6L687_PARC5|nr:6-hydroxymethylpterin diphosphokinase MptE-like protein [Paramaledivibacter caminithermalis]SHJ66614.1 Uncharacterized conserved protein [Paramaledivibacter caminithermalis DSM 15212]
MNEIYKKNLEILKTKYPHIYERIINEKESKIDVTVDESKDGNKYMIINSQNKKMYINSRYKPLDEARKWSGSIAIKEKSKIVLIGFGLGYRIKELISRLTSKSFLIVLEPSLKVFTEAIKNIDCSDIFLNNRLLLLVNEDIENIRETMARYINSYNLNNISTIIMPNYLNIFNQTIDGYIDLIKNKLTDERLNQNTILKQGLMWYTNFMNNIPFICGSVNLKSFIGKFKGKPAVIISAGPSLSKNVHLLKKIEDKAVIICVGTALKALLKKNIKPDIVVAMDAKHHNYNHFRNIQYDDIPLLYSPKVFSAILKKHKGDKIVFNDYEAYGGKTINSFYEEIEVLYSGGSVAHNALGFAQKIGADPIIFIGQDLAYEDNRTHAEGTVYENEKIDEENVVEIEGIYGRKVNTKIEWRQFLIWIENSIRKDKEDVDRIYIDATEGGAKIQGTEIMTFEEAISKYCIENIEVRKKFEEIITEGRNSIELNEVIKDLRAIRFELDEIRALCIKMFGIYDKIRDLYIVDQVGNEYEINKLWRRINNLEKEIKNKKQGLLTIEPIAMPYINLMDNECDDGIDKTIRQIENSKKLYYYIKESAEYIYYLVENFLEEYQEKEIKKLVFSVNIH